MFGAEEHEADRRAALGIARRVEDDAVHRQAAAHGHVAEVLDRARADATWRTTPALRIAGATAAVVCLALWTAVLTAVG